ncbi:hypothetical protein GCM10023235_14000 [Kitasatospora terrestris]|uniref:Uncharacterized protein n=1 Tax=Kitasatospora terrestris TaxID=258051 RepID=A0ABP9DCB5_9ACTN
MSAPVQTGSALPATRVYPWTCCGKTDSGTAAVAWAYAPEAVGDAVPLAGDAVEAAGAGDPVAAGLGLAEAEAAGGAAVGRCSAPGPIRYPAAPVTSTKATIVGTSQERRRRSDCLGCWGGCARSAALGSCCALFFSNSLTNSSHSASLDSCSVTDGTLVIIRPRGKWRDSPDAVSVLW